MTIDHLNLKLLILVDILQVLRFDFKKFRILEILNFYPPYASALQIGFINMNSRQTATLGLEAVWLGFILFAI